MTLPTSTQSIESIGFSPVGGAVFIGPPALVFEPNRFRNREVAAAKATYLNPLAYKASVP